MASSATCLATCTPVAGTASTSGTAGECWWERYRSMADARISASAAMARCGVSGNTSYGGSSSLMILEGRCWVFEHGRKELGQRWVICTHIAENGSFGRIGLIRGRFSRIFATCEPRFQLGGKRPLQISALTNRNKPFGGGITDWGVGIPGFYGAFLFIYFPIFQMRLFLVHPRNFFFLKRRYI